MQTFEVTDEIKIEYQPDCAFIRFPASSRRATEVEELLAGELAAARHLVANGQPEPDHDYTRININKADRAVLELLPSIGPKAAAFILENRPFADLQEMCEKMSEGTLKPSARELEGLVSF